MMLRRTPRAAVTRSDSDSELLPLARSSSDPACPALTSAARGSDQAAALKEMSTVDALCELARPFWSAANAERGTVWRRTLLLAAMCVLRTGLFVVISYAQRDFSTSLSGKDVDGFHAACLKFAGVVCVAAPLFAGTEYLQKLFCLRWREWLSTRLFASYFSKHVPYRLNHGGSCANGGGKGGGKGGGSGGGGGGGGGHVPATVVDNPDQRLSEDVAKFVTQTVGFAATLLGKVLNMIAFCGVLWSISPTLVLVLLLYSAFGTLCTAKLFGEALQRLAWNVLRREADLRFGLVRTREHAESIAFYGGEVHEASIINGRLAHVVDALRRQIVAERSLAIFQNVYEYATILVPALVIAPRYFAGEVEFGVVAQASMAFRVIRGALALLVDQYAELSQYSATTLRLYSLTRAMARAVEAAPPHPQSPYRPPPHHARRVEGGVGPAHDPAADPARESLDGPVHAHADASAATCADAAATAGPAATLEPLLHIRAADVRTPSSPGQLLASQLSLALRHGQRLLIVGPSGCGKSSVLRACAGLWHAEGVSLRTERAFFLPQSPYMALGCLRQNLGYPSRASSLADAEASAALERVGLAHLLPSLAAESAAQVDRGASGSASEREERQQQQSVAETDWARLLSLGEQQRLAFGRLLIHAPQLALLDEATSALDAANEKAMYQLLNEHVGTFVSVGHRASLINYHTHVLSLGMGGGGAAGNASWRLYSRAEYEEVRESE